MRNIYTFHIVFFALFFLLGINVAAADYNSAVPGGNYDDPSSWVGGKNPVDAWKTIEVLANSSLVKTGNFNWAPKVTIAGSLSVTGDFTSGYGGTTVSGSLNVTGAFNGNLIVEPGAVVRVGSISGGSFQVKNGGLLIVENGDCTLTAAASIESNGRVEIHGNLNMESQITTSNGSILIVYGNLNAISNWGMSIAGDVVVTGNFSASNGTIQNSGNVVIGGNYTHGGGGFGGTTSNNFYVVGDGSTVTKPDWTGSTGNKDDFVTNESNNNTLWDLVQEALPEVVGSLKQWIGITGNWNEAANWKSGQVPGVETNVSINVPDGAGRFMPVIETGTSVQIRSLSVAGGATLTLNGASLMVSRNMAVASSALFVAEPGSKVTIGNNLANVNGSSGTSVVIKNSVEKPTSFLVNKWASAAVTIYWQYPYGQYIALGHCVDGNLFPNYGASALIYKLVNNSWVNVSNDTGFNDIPLMGYYIAFKNANPSVSHIGSIRNSEYSFTMGDTWEMIANPYPTYIDVQNAAFNLNGADNTVYVARQGLGKVTFETYGIGTGVSVNGGSRYIAPGQAFYIRSRTNGTTFGLSPSVRTHGDGKPLKSAGIEDDVLRLELSGNGSSDEHVLVFRSIGSEDYSSYYDSEKKFSSDEAELSLFTMKENHRLVINALPAGLIDREVPLTVNVGKQNTGILTLSATNMAQFKPGVAVMLSDLVTGKSINLRQSPEYHWVATPGDMQNRFVLSFPAATTNEHQDATGVEDDAIGDEVLITAWRANNEMIVAVKDAAFEGHVHIELLDIAGRVLRNVVSHSASTRLLIPDAQPILLIRVYYRDAMKVIKNGQSR